MAKRTRAKTSRKPRSASEPRRVAGGASAAEAVMPDSARFRDPLDNRVLLAYYHVRLCGYLYESLRLRLTHHTIRRVNASNPPP